MYEGLLHAHSGWRWIVLLLLVLTVIASGMKFLSKDSQWNVRLSKLFKFNLISAHIMLLMGLILFFISPKVSFDASMMKDAVRRFFTMEHSLMMIIAIVLITIGNSRMKRAADTVKKYKAVFIFNLIALILVLAMVPWPFRESLGASWF